MTKYYKWLFLILIFILPTFITFAKPQGNPVIPGGIRADATFDREAPRLAMLHFPPWIEGREPTPVVRILREAGVRVCVYGHLHGEDHTLAIRGTRDGIRFEFVAADAIGFAPLEIRLDGVMRGSAS